MKSKTLKKNKVIKIETERVWDKRLIYALAFALPFLSMLVIYAIFGVYPFGDRTNLVMDLNGQYADFFAFYHRVLTGGDSIMYSFTKEMGGNVFGLFAYYLSSPFFLLALFFPSSIMPEGIALITLLKIGSCGLTFAIFIRNVFKKTDLSVLLFSCAYALMTYSMHYSMCIMWLDGAIWLPIILLGTERILNGKSSWLFLFAYAMTLISNYYTAYMSTLFTILYFFSRYISTDGEKSAKDLLFKALKILGAGIVCVLLAMVVLYPTFIDIFNGKMASGSYVADGFWNIDIENIARRLFIGQYDSITNSGNPNIFCGILCGIMTGVFFFNPNIKIKAKLAALAVFAILIASFFIKRLDMAWHIFQYPNWYPYRYAYVFCFFSVMTAFWGFTETKSENRNWIFAGMAAYTLLILGVFIFKKDVLTNEKLAKISLVFAAVYIAAILLYINLPKKYSQYICAALILITCGELVLNGYTTICGLNKQYNFKSRSEYTAAEASISEFSDFISERDDGLYRAEKTFTRTDNDSMTFGYNGMTHYSSTYNNNVLKFVSRMGMLQPYILINYRGSTLVTDSLLGVKYLASEDRVNDEYDLIKETDEFNIYENPYALPFCFSAPSDALNTPAFGSSNLKNQDLFAESIFNKSFMTQVKELTYLDNTLSFTAPSDGAYYLNLNEEYENDIRLIINGVEQNYQYDENLKKIYFLGSCKTGDSVQVIFASSGAASNPEVCMLDIDAFEQACLDKQANGSLEISDFDSTRIEGTIALEDDEIIFTTIPYEKGWSAYIDGEKTETLCAQDVFLAVRAEAGEHTVVLKYAVPGFAASLAVSLITLAGVLLAIFRKQVFTLCQKLKRNN